MCVAGPYIIFATSELHVFFIIKMIDEFVFPKEINHYFIYETICSLWVVSKCLLIKFVRHSFVPYSVHIEVNSYS